MGDKYAIVLSKGLMNEDIN